MSQTERFEYWLTVKDDANPAIKQTGENAATAGGKAAQAAKGVDALAHSVNGLRTSATVSAGALDAHTKKTVSFMDSVKGMQSKVAPAAGAVAGLATALGQTGGEAGKALAAVGQLGAAFGAGGIFGVAITAGTLAIDMFFDHLAKEEKKALEAFEADAKLIDAARARRDAAIESKGVAVRELEQVRMVNALRARGFDDEARRQEALGEMQVRYMALVKRIADEKHAAAKGILQQELKALGDEMTATLGVVNELLKAEKLAAARAKHEQAVREETERWAAIARQANIDAREALEASKELFDGFATTDLTSSVMRGEKIGLGKALADDRLAKDEKKQFADLTAQAGADVDADRDAFDGIAEDRAAAHQQATERMLEQEAAFQTEMASLGLQGYGIAVGAFDQLITDMITGQEKAVEAFAVNVMRQAGQAMVSSGTQLAAMATVSALTPGGQPLAIAQGAAAAGLIAGGLALGAVATGVEHTAIKGGQLGKALPEDKAEARSSSGTGSLGSSGSRSGSGGMHVTIVYGGVSAPDDDDAALAVARVLGVAHGRGIINERVQRR